MLGDSAPTPLFRRYDFLLMGSPQHAIEPSAPLVTTNSELHLLHEYRLPVSLANFHRLLMSSLGTFDVNTNPETIIASALGAVNEPPHATDNQLRNASSTAWAAS